MRERTPLTRAIISRLPKLRLIASTAFQNASIDVEAATKYGIEVVHTGYNSTPTIEMTWALILGSVRNLAAENASLRAGGWQRLVGDDLTGRTLGVLGLGRIGSEVAKIGKAFGMNVIAWSQNLTAQRAAEAGSTLISKEELFRQADILTIHLVLSSRSRGLVRRYGAGAHEAYRAFGKYVAWSDRRRGRPSGSSSGRQDRKRCDRRL
jgi:phosphoglycerate dehydrogenase-like enzyme